MNYRKRKTNQGSCINFLVTKSQTLQEGEIRMVGKLNPEDLEALAQEEDPLIQMEALKALPTPLLGKRIVRSRLSANPAKVLTGFDAWKYRRKLEWRRLRIQTKEATTFLELWGSSFKRIEGVFGNGVSSYFRFLRWLFLLNIAIFLLMFIFIVIPHIVFDKPTTTSDVVTTTPAMVTMTSQGTTESPTTVDPNVTLATSSLVLHEYCTSMYVVKYDVSITQVLLDFMQGTGWMEKTILFYGVYKPRDLTIGTWDAHQYNYNMPLAYLLVTLAYMALSFYAMISHTNVTLREQLKNSFTSKRSNRGYANLGFASWDFTLYSPEAAISRHNNLFNEMRGHLEEERLLARRQARSTSDLCLLVLIRTIINVFVLATLAGAAYLIYYATSESTKFKEGVDYARYHQLVQLGMEFLPSLTITFLNFLIPIIFTQVARGEDYHPDFEVRITLIRTVFLRLASLAVLLATIYYQVLCSPRDSCQVGQPPCPQLRCWETYVGQNLYKLLILNFIVNVAVVFLVETPKQIIGSKCKFKVLKLIGQKSEFAIPKNVLDLVYVQTICWLGSFFAPLIPVMSMCTFFFLFYLKKLTVLYNYKPAKKPYRSSRSQVFFMLVLLAAFLLCCIPIGYCIWKVSPSLGCGPFRNYTHMYDVINSWVATWPMVLQDIVGLLTSTTSTVVLIIILGLLLYYYRGASKGHQEAGLLLREQMMLESRDKQFLLARLNEVTGSQQQAAASLSDVKPETDRTSIDMPAGGSQKNYSTFSPPSEGQKNYGAFGDSGAPLASSESVSRDSATP